MKENAGTDFETLYARQKEDLPCNTKAREYLKERGLLSTWLSPPQLEVGYNSGINWKKLKQSITFPLKDKNGNTTSLYNPRIAESGGYNVEFGRHHYSENRNGLYSGYLNKNTETLMIT